MAQAQQTILEITGEIENGKTKVFLDHGSAAGIATIPNGKPDFPFTSYLAEAQQGEGASAQKMVHTNPANFDGPTTKDASIAIEGNTATLRQNGKECAVPMVTLIMATIVSENVYKKLQALFQGSE